MAAGCDIFRVAPFVWSMLPPAESWVRIPKPVTNAVDRGLRKPETWNVTAVPPLISWVAKLVTERTPLEKEHWIFAYRAEELEEHDIAPYKYSNYPVWDSGFHLGKDILIWPLNGILWLPMKLTISDVVWPTLWSTVANELLTKVPTVATKLIPVVSWSRIKP